MKINIGFIQKPFGIKGEVKIKPTTDFIEERYKVGSNIYLTLNDKTTTYTIQSVRHHQGSLLVKFEGLDSLNEVEFFHKGIIEVDKDERHDLDKDEFYFSDLVGCDVFNENEKIGVVKEVLDLPAHPVMRLTTSGDDILIPFVETFIKEVLLDLRRIDINFMEGLF